MRRIASVVAVLALSGCSFAPPPRCCPADDPAVRQQESLRTRAAGFQQVADEKLAPHWPFGILLSVRFSDRTMHEVTAFDDPPDAALYTGIYAAAQAFRYASTSGEEKAAALRAVRAAANALHTLATVPGYAGGLARAASKDPTTIQCSPSTKDCYPNTHGVWWLGNTSRDQYTGWWFGNAIVYRLVDDPEIRATIRADVGEMIRAIRQWNYRLHDQNGQPNSGTAGAVHHQMRITWHLIAATILPEQPYLQWYQEQLTALDLDEAWLEDAFDVTNVDYDYYGFNLGFLNAYNMVMLETDPRLRARFLGWMERELYRYVRNTGNAFFDFMQMAAAQTRLAEVIEADRESLARFPGPPASWECVSPPQQPYSAASKRLYLVNHVLGRLHLAKASAFPQAAKAYPIDQRCRHEFQWAESPYKETCCCACANVSGGCARSTYASAFCSSRPQVPPPPGFLVYTGTDYLIAYWLGRYHGFLVPDD